MNISARLAWRNLWRNRRRTWLTSGAMIFSNVLLVFMIALQLGSYDMMTENTLKVFTGHLQLQHQDYQDQHKIHHTLTGITDKADRLRRLFNTNKIAARASAFALASSEERSFGIQLNGVQPEFENEVSSLPGLIKEGHYLNSDGTAEIVIGRLLANNLKVSVGDEITLLGSGRDGSFAAGVVTVVGIIDSGMSELDRHMAQMPLGYFQSLFSMGDSGHSIAITANDLKQAETWQQQIESEFSAMITSEQIAVLHWEQLIPGLKQAIQVDFVSAWFMYAVLVILVSFSMLNTQLMSVLERTREFGTMMALGVGPGQLSRLVIQESFFLATMGLLIGTAIGGILTLYLNHAGFVYPGTEAMADKFNLPSTIYPKVSIISIFVGPAIVFLGSMLASIYPALRLFFLQPLEAMREAR